MKECEVMIVNSIIKVLKVGPQYTQAILVREGFLGPADGIMAVGYKCGSNSQAKPNTLQFLGAVWRSTEHALNVKTVVLHIQVSLLENASQYECKMTML